MKISYTLSTIFAVLCYVVAFTACGLLMFVPDMALSTSASACFCFVAICVLPFVAFVPVPILAWVEEHREQKAIEKSHQIMSYRHDLDAYLEKIQEDEKALQDAWNDLQTVPSYVSRLPEAVFQHNGWKETVYAEQGNVRLVECTDCGIVRMYRLETPDRRIQNKAYYDEQSAIAAYAQCFTISSKIV